MKGQEFASQPQTGLNPAAQVMQKPGMQRAMVIARLLAAKAKWLVVGAVVLQFIMPAGNRPADWIGRFHGGIENAEIGAKVDANVDMTRRQAEASAREQAKVQWEMEVLRQQMSL